MADNALKTPLSASLQRLSRQTADQAISLTGRALPCSVVSVDGAFVTVKFEVNTAPFTVRNIEVPIGSSEYIRLPIRPGDTGVVFPADVRLGGITGLGGGTPDMTQPANLSALVFFPISSKAFSSFPASSLALYSAEDSCVAEVTPSGVTVSGDAGNLDVQGNITTGSGWTGSFSDIAGNVYSVVDGIIVGGP